MPSGVPLALSTFHVTGLPEPAVFELGLEHALSGRTDRTLYGWAELPAGIVWGQGLGLDCNYDPFRHVDVNQWPEEKDRQLALAQELAAESILVLKNPPDAKPAFVRGQ